MVKSCQEVRNTRKVFRKIAIKTNSLCDCDACVYMFLCVYYVCAYVCMCGHVCMHV